LILFVLHSTPPPSLFAEMSVDTGLQIWDCIKANLAALIGKECGNKAIGFVVALWQKISTRPQNCAWLLIFRNVLVAFFIFYTLRHRADPLKHKYFDKHC
jgi:hypothetical protein